MLSSGILLGMSLILFSGGGGGDRGGGTGPVFVGREGRAGTSIKSGLMDSLLVGGVGATISLQSSSSTTT